MSSQQNDTSGIGLILIEQIYEMTKLLLNGGINSVDFELIKLQHNFLIQLTKDKTIITNQHIENEIKRLCAFFCIKQISVKIEILETHMLIKQIKEKIDNQNFSQEDQTTYDLLIQQNKLTEDEISHLSQFPEQQIKEQINQFQCVLNHLNNNKPSQNLPIIKDD
jgi:hypothetical protein